MNSLRTFIEDIDAADGDNPQLCAEYVKDIYEYLRLLEREYAVKADYLSAPAGSKSKPEINGKMRAILIDWLIQVSVYCYPILFYFHCTISIFRVIGFTLKACTIIFSFAAS